MGVLQNSKILESIGFVQTEELNPDTGYKKREWVRPLRESDQEYIDSVVREVYEALSGKDAKLTLMTGHTSKGLENEAVRLWKDWDPTYLGTSQSDVATSGEQPAKTKEQLEKEKNKIDEVLNRQEFNLYYTVISRAKRLLDMGGLGTLFKRQDFIDKMEQKIAEELGEIDNNPIVDKRVFKGQGDYYDSLNKSKVERAEAYIRSLNHSLGLARMERTVPFRYATDSDIDFERQSARRMIDDVEMNPDAERLKDQNNRSGLLEILAMIESGASIASLSDYDRQRLFAYLGSSSLGSSSALLDDPTEKIKGAIAELNRRLGIE
jgi:ATP-dependent exoDNAse (exonuclease V) beta subunit